MTDTEKRRAIAEFAGWTGIVNSHPLAAPGAWVGYPPGRGPGSQQELPDYLGDLNAMHEVEENLNHQQQEDYVLALRRITVVPAEVEYGAINVISTKWIMIHSTASQRAEALLAVIGKGEK